MPATTATTPGPTIFVLYGATGDLAERMVLPAFYELAIAGLLPPDWRLVGNGRGDVSHAEFVDLVHAALTEFGPHPDDGPWAEFRERLRLAGGGFTTEDPGTLFDVIDEIRNDMGDDTGNDTGRDPQLVLYLALPPSAFGAYTTAIGEHGPGRGFPRGLGEAVRHLAGGLP